MKEGEAAGMFMLLAAIFGITALCCAFDAHEWHNRMQHLADDAGGDLHMITEEISSPPFVKKRWVITADGFTKALRE